MYYCIDTLCIDNIIMQDPTEPHTSSDLIMKQIDSRLQNLEKDMQEIKQKLTDKSFENKVNLAMEDLQEKVNDLNVLIKSQKQDDYNYKVKILY